MTLDRLARMAAHSKSAADNLIPARMARYYDPVDNRRHLEPDEDQAISQGEKQWLPEILDTDATPIPSMMASPGRQGILAGLAGAAAGGGAGDLAQRFGGLHGPLPIAGGALAGAALAGLPRAVHQYLRNEQLKETMRRLPHDATKRDYDAERLMSEAFESSYGKQGSDFFLALAEKAAEAIKPKPRLCSACGGRTRGAWCPACRKFMGKQGSDLIGFLVKAAVPIEPLIEGAEKAEPVIAKAAPEAIEGAGKVWGGLKSMVGMGREAAPAAEKVAPTMANLAGDAGRAATTPTAASGLAGSWQNPHPYSASWLPGGAAPLPAEIQRPLAGFDRTGGRFETLIDGTTGRRWSYDMDGKWKPVPAQYAYDWGSRVRWQAAAPGATSLVDPAAAPTIDNMATAAGRATGQAASTAAPTMDNVAAQAGTGAATAAPAAGAPNLFNRTMSWIRPPPAAPTQPGAWNAIKAITPHVLGGGYAAGSTYMDPDQNEQLDSPTRLLTSLGAGAIGAYRPGVAMARGTGEIADSLTGGQLRFRDTLPAGALLAGSQAGRAALPAGGKLQQLDQFLEHPKGWGQNLAIGGAAAVPMITRGGLQIGHNFISGQADKHMDDMLGPGTSQNLRDATSFQKTLDAAAKGDPNAIATFTQSKIGIGSDGKFNLQLAQQWGQKQEAQTIAKPLLLRAGIDPQMVDFVTGQMNQQQTQALFAQKMGVSPQALQNGLKMLSAGGGMGGELQGFMHQVSQIADSVLGQMGPIGSFIGNMSPIQKVLMLLSASGMLGGLVSGSNGMAMISGLLGAGTLASGFMGHGQPATGGGQAPPAGQPQPPQHQDPVITPIAPAGAPAAPKGSASPVSPGYPSLLPPSPYGGPMGGLQASPYSA